MQFFWQKASGPVPSGDGLSASDDWDAPGFALQAATERRSAKYKRFIERTSVGGASLSASVGPPRKRG
jgi:hypothetical protein